MHDLVITAPNTWIGRAVARGGATTFALAGHLAVVLALGSAGQWNFTISEPPAAIAVEIVLAPPSNSPASFSSEASAVEPVPATSADISGDDAADRMIDRPAQQTVTMAATGTAAPSPAPQTHTAPRATGVRNAPAAQKHAPLDIAPVAESTGNSTGPAGGSTGTEGSGASASDVPSHWKARLLSHLDRFKRYPDSARARHAEGTALLSFGMDRSGRVLGYSLVRSSGVAELDEEVLSMIERASPLPPAPPEMLAEVVQLVVPVRFRM